MVLSLKEFIGLESSIQLFIMNIWNMRYLEMYRVFSDFIFYTFYMQKKKKIICNINIQKIHGTLL